MTKVSFAALAAVLCGLCFASNTSVAARGATAKQTAVRAATPRPKPAMAVAHMPELMSADAQNKMVGYYCTACHDDEGKTGGLTLEHFDAAHPEQNAQIAEKMIRKLRLGMMPPPSVTDRPDAATVNAFVATLENRLDAWSTLHPNPGRRTFQRLNRAEYTRAIRDLLDLEIDVNAFLPPDTVSAGFDNIADVQAFSPTLLDGYLRAASRISSLAVGDKNASPGEATYKVPRTESQMHHVEGTPLGTRGGISVVHIFPADGEYTFRIMLHGVPTGQLYGSTVRGEQLEVAINGERVALLDINYKMSEQDPTGLNLTTPRIHVKAGPQHVTAAFIQRFDGPIDDLIAPIDYTMADTQIGDGYGITTLPHVRDFAITGPFRVTGVSDTPSRRKIFTCRPTSPNEEATCASIILKRLATQAYREPASSGDIEPLVKFYEQGRSQGGDFESGIRLALQAILASPRFVFRFEEEPATVRPGQPFRLSDTDLASRLSFFLWDSLPDAELLRAAANGTLHVPAVLEKQVRRMLADSRSEALSTRFASQWLRLQDVDKIQPDALLYPSYDNRLAESYKRETQLLFDSIVREDRNILDLFTADYTFVNERIARMYGIPNVTGEAFQRVKLGPELDYRRGILGQGSILMQTSVADRTSPVQRGKWIMEVLLGSPPPPPPPNVPLLEETKAVAGGKTLSVRERMEEHRKNPACTSCHRFIDPIGLALENFDVTGAWRIKDNGVPVDPNGDMYDGTKVDGPASLRHALLNHSESLIRNFTENLMAYALGRRVEYYDGPTIRAIVRKAAQNENRFSHFVIGIVNSAAFQMSRSEPVVTTDADKDK